MSSSVGVVTFLCDQLSGIGDVGSRKMFGDYMIYLNRRPVFLVCDDTLFVKITPETTAFLGEDAPKGIAYAGARERYVVENVDDADFLKRLALILEPLTPIPTKKK